MSNVCRPNHPQQSASCALLLMLHSFILCAYAFTLGYLSLLRASQIIALSIHPVFRKNGEYSVDSDRARLMANLIVANLDTQSFWVAPMQDLNIWPIVWFTRSTDPSVSVWYMLDMHCLTPINLLQCIQNKLTNRTSWLLMIVLGNPWHQEKPIMP